MARIHYEAELTPKEHDLFSEFLRKLRELRAQEAIVFTTANNEVKFGEPSFTTNVEIQ